MNPHAARLARFAILLCAAVGTTAGAAECSATQAFGQSFEATLASGAPQREIYKLYWQASLPDEAAGAKDRTVARFSYRSKKLFAVQKSRRFEKSGIFGSHGDDVELRKALKASLDRFTVDVRVLQADPENVKAEKAGKGWLVYRNYDAVLHVEVAAYLSGNGSGSALLELQCSRVAVSAIAWTERGIVYPNRIGSATSMRFEMQHFRRPGSGLLADSERLVEELTKAEIESPEIERKRAALAGAESLADYAVRAQGWIRKFVFYPTRSAYAEEEGTVRLRARTTRKGEVIDVRVVRSSGYGALDDAAQAAFWNADPLPLPSADILPGATAMDFEVPIQFTL